MAPMFYSLVRILVDLSATSYGNEAKLRAEVLASVPCQGLARVRARDETTFPISLVEPGA
jgi:hypothetical protein